MRWFAYVFLLGIGWNAVAEARMMCKCDQQGKIAICSDDESAITSDSYYTCSGRHGNLPIEQTPASPTGGRNPAAAAPTQAQTPPTPAQPRSPASPVEVTVPRGDLIGRCSLVKPKNEEPRNQGGDCVSKVRHALNLCQKKYEVAQFSCEMDCDDGVTKAKLAMKVTGARAARDASSSEIARLLRDDNVKLASAVGIFKNACESDRKTCESNCGQVEAALAACGAQRANAEKILANEIKKKVEQHDLACQKAMVQTVTQADRLFNSAIDSANDSNRSFSSSGMSGSSGMGFSGMEQALSAMAMSGQGSQNQQPQAAAPANPCDTDKASRACLCQGMSALECEQKFFAPTAGITEAQRIPTAAPATSTALPPGVTAK